MAAKKQAAQESTDETKPQRSNAEVYAEHNHESARNFAKDKQCNCDQCQEHLDSL